MHFCDRVGWRKGNSYVNYFDLTFDPSISLAENFLFWVLGAFGGGVGVGLISSLASRLVNCSK
jgi:hypothetical protein